MLGDVVAARAAIFEAVAAERLELLVARTPAAQVRRLGVGLAEAGSLLRLTGWLCLIAGLTIAALGWRGIGPRLAEYR